MILLVLKAGESYIGNEEEMKQKGKKIWTPYAMVFPAFAVMMLVVVLPIINTIMQSFKTADGKLSIFFYEQRSVSEFSFYSN